MRLALATWPQIDPAVEGVVSRIAAVHRLVEAEAHRTLARVGLTKEEFKVLLGLHGGPRSHGALCRELGVATGTMTNRLDKLERTGLLTRLPDPEDRRGVRLALTDGGRSKLDECIDTGAHRERQLLAGLSAAERAELNELLRRLLASLEVELGAGRD